ncbi:MAG: hypothetical protein ACOXZR_02815 [Bacilli bacterium]
MIFLIGVFLILIISLFLVMKNLKRMWGKLITLGIILLVFYLGMLFLEVNRVYSLKKPLFVFSSQSYQYNDYSKVVYKGFGYKVEVKMIEKQKIISSELYLLKKKIAVSAGFVTKI